MFPLRSLPVHVASVGGGDVLCLIDFVRQARLSVWVSAYLLVRPAGWLAGWRAGQGSARLRRATVDRPKQNSRAKLLQPGQGRLRQVDDDDIQERGCGRGRIWRSDAGVLTGPEDSRSKKKKQGGNDGNETTVKRVAGGGGGGMLMGERGRRGEMETRNTHTARDGEKEKKERGVAG